MSNAISDLEPVTQKLCRQLLAQWEARISHPIRVTHTLRSLDEQLRLWQQGGRLDGKVWVVVEPHRIVTKAQPGESAHNYGAAFDVCFIGPDPYLHAHEVSNKEPDPLWGALGEVGENLGLEWGGSWHSFKDRPHFQNPSWKAFRDHHV